MLIDEKLLDEVTRKAKESGTVIFEVKDGPYTPLEPDDMLLSASW